MSRERPSNRLLRALPEEDFESLAAHLETVPMPLREVLYIPGDSIGHVYFPNGGVVSVVTPMADGARVETATIGVEGIVGLEVLLGDEARASGEVIIQVHGPSAERLPAAALRRELARQGAAYRLFGRYSQTVLAQMMQSAACNALHQLPMRCARWLLMTHDRVGTDEFGLSHEFLATMLAVRRSSVTVVAQTLQAAGLIAYHHGQVSILDRRGLEDASCECYAVIRDRFAALALP